jgi:hypothetical protein
MAKSRYSPEVRAAAIAALLAGQSVSAVAKEYELPKGTVSHWKKQGSVPGGPKKGADDSESISDLLLALLRANLRGLINGSRVMMDDKWLRQQGAVELGTFMGITHDKVVRMLEAMDRSAPAAAAAPDPAGPSDVIANEPTA